MFSALPGRGLVPCLIFTVTALCLKQSNEFRFLKRCVNSTELLKGDPCSGTVLDAKGNHLKIHTVRVTVPALLLPLSSFK